MGHDVTFAANGSDCTGYFSPAAGGGPGVIVIQEWWGLNDHVRSIVDRFATAGFSALAPDLYRGATATEPDEAGKLMMSLNLGQAAKDISAAADFLATADEVTGDRVGIVGYCMGGALALMAATTRPDVIGACAPYYGVIPFLDPMPDWAAITAVVRGHFAGEDAMFPPDKVVALEATLKELGVDATLTVHNGAQHAFFNDTRPDVYDAALSATCFDDTVALFRSTLV